MNVTVPPVTVGWILAVIVLLLAIVLWVLGRMAPLEAILFSLLALARIL